MKKQSKLFFAGRMKSFHYAFSGLKTVFLEETNFRIHLIAAVIAVIFGFLLKISILEWSVIIFVIGFVFVTEILNSSIETLADTFSLEKNENVKKLKDMSAAAVLVSAISALIVGLIIFLPKILTLIK